MTPSMEQRLEALEGQVQALAKENAELKSELGWKGDTAPVLARPGASENKLVVGGFLQAQGEFGHYPDARFNGTKNRLYFRRARIYLAGTFAEDFDFKTEVDLWGSSVVGGTGAGPKANDVFVNWHKYDAMNIRFGLLKPAFGAEALAPDTGILTIERTFPSDILAESRVTGLGLYGALFGKKVHYLAVGSNGTGATVGVADARSIQKSARITYTAMSTPDNKLTLGIDGMWTKDNNISRIGLGLTGNAFTGNRDLGGVDLQWIHGPLTIESEWLHGKFTPSSPSTVTPFSAEGWHVTAAYFLMAKLQAVVREEQFDPNTEIGGNTSRTFTLGLNYLIKGDDLKLMVDYLHGSYPGSLNDGGRLLTRFQVMY
jgi:phosphate-selective porin